MEFKNETDHELNHFSKLYGPLQLVYRPEKKIFYQNSNHHQSRYSRPMGISIKETNNVTKEEIKYIKSQTTALTSSQIDDASIKHRMIFTIVDGKVYNAATHTKSTI